MNDKTYPFFCEWCASLKYGKPPEPEKDDPNVIRFTPHYICADCLRKILTKKESGEITDA